MPGLIYDDRPWGGDRTICPCDYELSEWLARHEWPRDWRDRRTIFHMGTGSHHLLGMNEALHPERNVFVIGLTATPAEFDAYRDMVIRHPPLALRYQVIFGDLYTFDPRGFLPGLDIATLFHLCEFTDEKRAEYGGVDDRAVVERFVDALRPGGLLLFYTRSSAYHHARPIIETMIEDGILIDDEPYGTIRVCRKDA